MWLEIGGIVIPPFSHALAVEASAHVEGLDGIALRTWWPTSDFMPLYWYAGIVLYRATSVVGQSSIGNVVEPPPDLRKESHVFVTGATAALLDVLFAASTGPTVKIGDGETTIAFGQAQMHSKILLKRAVKPEESLWLYEFIFYTADGYRVDIVRRHAGPWSDVMLADTLPRVGSPVTAGPTLHDRASETTYVYMDDAGSAVEQAVYAGSFDVQFDSGCRYSQSLRSVSGGRGTVREWNRDTPRFWTLAEAVATANEEWEKYAGRIIFGGRIEPADMGPNMPATIVANYQLPGSPPSPPPPPSEFSFATAGTNASGTEEIDLGPVKSDAAIESQVAAYTLWELHRRRNFSTAFLGLVPWRMTPFDIAVEWRLPIDGIQLPVTIVEGVESRSWDPPLATVTNPAPAGGQITVTFTRPANPTPGFDTPPAGQLTRDAYGSSPPFVPPAMVGTSVSYVYDSLADGSYTVAPGAPWSPTTLTVTVVNGSTHTMAFNR